MPPSECDSSTQSQAPDPTREVRGADCTHNKPKFILRSGRSILAEVKSHALAFRLTKKSSYLTSSEKLIKDLLDLDSQPGQNILQQNVHLVEFVNNIEDPATEQMAEMAFEDIKSMWPIAAEDLTPAILLQIHHCIRASKVAVKYRHLRSFLLSCASCMEQLEQPMTDAEAKQIGFAAKLIAALKDDTSSHEKPQTRRKMLADLLDARTERLEETNRLIKLKLKTLFNLQETRITGEPVTHSYRPEGTHENGVDMRGAKTMDASTSDSSVPTFAGITRQEGMTENEVLADSLDKLAGMHEQSLHLCENHLKTFKSEQRQRILEANIAAEIAVKFPNLDKEWIRNMVAHIHHSNMSAYEESINEQLKAMEEESSFVRELAKDVRELK